MGKGFLAHFTQTKYSTEHGDNTKGTVPQYTQAPHHKLENQVENQAMQQKIKSVIICK